MTGCIWSDYLATLIVAILSAIAARYGIVVPPKPEEVPDEPGDEEPGETAAK